MAAQKKQRRARKRKLGPRPGPRALSATWGLPIRATWMEVFKLNARASRAERLTDPQITDRMCKEFPGHERYRFVAVNTIRRAINRNGIGPYEAPSKPFKRYGPDGSVLPDRRAHRTR